MSNARNLARLIPNASGVLPESILSSLSASKVTGSLSKNNAYSGSVVQTTLFRATVSDIVVTTTETTLASTTITTQGNSKLFVWVNSGQIYKSTTSTATNPALIIKVDGTTISLDNNHSWYGGGGAERIFILNQGMSSTLSAGTHNISVIGSVYNGSCTFNYQGLERSISAIVFEVLV